MTTTVALVVAAGCVLALGQGLRYVVDKGFGSANPELLNAALGAMVGVAALLSAATFVRFYLMMTLGERVVTDLRRSVFNHILALEPGYFEATRTGEVISRLTNDTMLVQQVIGYGLSMFVRNLLMMIGAAVMMFVVSWKLAAFVLLGIPATLVPILLLGRRVRRMSRDNQDRVADVRYFPGFLKKVPDKDTHLVQAIIRPGLKAKDDDFAIQIGRNQIAAGDGNRIQ